MFLKKYFLFFILAFLFTFRSLFAILELINDILEITK